jgi:hypothetical protein
MPVIRTVVPAVLVVAFLAVASLGSTAAGAARYSTTVVVSFKLPAFHGTLKSSKAACEKNRTVKLYKVKPGPDRMLKRGASNARGRWTTPIGNPVPSGSYYVKATHRGNCKAAKSGVIPVA